MTPIVNRTFAPRFLPAATLAAMLCAGCAVTGDQTDEPQYGKRHAIYTCRGLGAVEVRFFESTGIAQLTHRGRTLHLKQQRAGTATIYSDGANSVRRAGNDLTVELQGQEATRCTPQRPGGD